ncbi:MAG: HD domain-containing protein [Firmicutes bacterium]|nr:HD domain-containing protein [Bacillota bacterium]
MLKIYERYFDEIIDDLRLSGDIEKDSYNILINRGRNRTADHSSKVAEECKRLARRFGEREEIAAVAGYLHDISAVIPNEHKLEIAKELELEILPEEEEFPMILHQKISRVIARDIWKITNQEILSAIECHTTLKKNSSSLDMILFISDKLQWDQDGEPPYIKELKKGLDISLEQASFNFIKHLLDNKSELKVIHPWLLDAYNDLKIKLNVND